MREKRKDKQKRKRIEETWRIEIERKRIGWKDENWNTAKDRKGR